MILGVDKKVVIVNVKFKVFEEVFLEEEFEKDFKLLELEVFKIKVEERII